MVCEGRVEDMAYRYVKDEFRNWMVCEGRVDELVGKYGTS